MPKIFKYVFALSVAAFIAIVISKPLAVIMGILLLIDAYED